jgi:RNA-directed DNA polymerase
LLIKPSKKSVAGLREKLRDAWRQSSGQNVADALRRLNPIVRGWANYFRTVVASKTFDNLDAWMFHRAIRYLRRNYPKKSAAWHVNHFWGRLNPKANDPWVFGDKRSGRYLLRFRWF